MLLVSVIVLERAGVCSLLSLLAGECCGGGMYCGVHESGDRKARSSVAVTIFELCCEMVEVL